MMRVRMRFWMGGLSAAAAFGINVAGAFAACTTPVNSIDSFVCCVNSRVPATGNVSNSVQCLPPGCSITLTMSGASAQAACSLGTCQLPRVILQCPGPAAGQFFRPSFLLCPQDSGSAPDFGINRVEIGEDTADGDLIMADVPFPPGHVPVPFDNSVKSSVGNDKDCNSCHTAGTPDGDLITSQPIDPFTDNPGAIISTDQECKEANPDTSKFSEQSLADICKCIANNRPQIVADAKAEGTPFEKNMNVLLGLCRALSSYQTQRGVCGGVAPNQPTPPLCPPACAETGVNGKFSQSAQTFNANIYVTGSTTYPAGVNPTYTYVQPGGIMSVNDPVTGNVISGSAFSSAELASLGSGNFTLTASASVNVNGTRTNVKFTASKTAGVISYQIKRASDNAVLSSGTGVGGKSFFGLGFAPPI
jgi:hypothetical protein